MELKICHKIAFLFPGQGSQVLGMGKDFFENFKESALVFEEASDTALLNFKKLCFDGPFDELTLTENLQPALFTVEASLLAAVRAHCEVLPFVCAGHSLGEYSALYAVGSLSLKDGVKLTKLRGKAMQNAVAKGQGTMAAILGLDPETIKQLCKKAFELTNGQVVEPANFNAPGQVVISGTVDGVSKACELLKSEEFKGAKSIPLSVSAPFHCSLMRPAQKEMEKPLSDTGFLKPTCPVIPNCLAKPVRNEVEFPGLLLDQIVRPVLWEQSMQVLPLLQIEKVFEIGPGKVLAGLHKRNISQIPIFNISTVKQMQEFLK